MSRLFAMAKVKVPKPISGGLILSYRCTAACRHCMYACSPQWKGDWFREHDLREILSLLAGRIVPSPWGDQAISLNHGLHFTGGEPFLNFPTLLSAVEIAHELEIPSTFVETNCSWCMGDQNTKEKLALLKKAGLRGILISVNPFYAEHVPFERTERCIRISEEVFGSNVMIYQQEYYHRFKQLGIRARISLEDYIGLTSKEDLTQRVELFLMGRAAHRLKALYPAYPARRFFDEPCTPPFLRNWHNHFDNYGNFLPGYCGGISLGDWRNLDYLTNEGVDLQKNPILGFLIGEDMRGLLKFANNFGYQGSPRGYVSKCHLCLDLRTYLVSKGDFQELKPKEFYEHVGA